MLFRSKFQVADSTVLNHRVEVVEGVLAVECTQRVASALAFLFIRNPFESISPAREIRL